MANLVKKVLQKEKEKEAQFKPTTVEKSIHLLIDEGNLLAIDQNPIDKNSFKAAKEQFLIQLARDNTQLLINKIWELPHERKDDVILAKLPEPTTLVPREKPVPKKRPSTRWEAFAKVKGIHHIKKSRMLWDETKKEWRPRWGYNRTNDDTKDWMIEVPDHVDPYEDQFEKRSKAKSERSSKNELQRLRNMARSSKSKVPGVGITPTDNPSKDTLHRALTLAKRSTASVGKFTDALPKEKPAKGMAKKRKFEANIGDFASERKRQLDIVRGLGKDKVSLDVTKAVNKHMREQDTDSRQRKGKAAKAGQGKKRSRKTAKETGRGSNSRGGKAPKGLPSDKKGGKFTGGMKGKRKGKR